MRRQAERFSDVPACPEAIVPVTWLLCPPALSGPRIGDVQGDLDIERGRRFHPKAFHYRGEGLERTQHCRSMTIKNKYIKRRRKPGPLSLEITEEQAGCGPVVGDCCPAVLSQGLKEDRSRAPAPTAWGQGLEPGVWTQLGPVEETVLRAEAVSPRCRGYPRARRLRLLSWRVSSTGVGWWGAGDLLCP